MTIIQRPSPNREPRNAPIDMLVLHYTGMKSCAEALDRLCDAASKVSAHYTIDRDGTTYAHVAEDHAAWHAGVACWDGASNINARSIGIELVNPGHEFGYVPFADEQIEALIVLANDILKRHAIRARNVVGHSDVAPARKTDPGELFPWKHLSSRGIGAWPLLASRERGDWKDGLSRYGYGVPPDRDVSWEAVVMAFQRHFRPKRIDGDWDSECDDALWSLLADR